MTIEALVQVIPPPEAPTASFSGAWGPVEAELGTRLPQDYKDFVRIYGCGYILDFMWIYVPYFWNRDARLVSAARKLYRSNIEYPDFGFSLWPDPEGLLLFGMTSNGDDIYWQTKGDPDSWTVAIWSRGDVALEFLDCGLTDFLAGLATGTNIPQCLPDDLLPCKTPFRPSPATDPKASSRPQVPLSGSQSPRFGPVEIRRSFAWRSTF